MLAKPDHAAAIKRLLSEARSLRLEHKAARRYVEAAACSIREIALSDSLAIVENREKRPMTWLPNAK